MSKVFDYLSEKFLELSREYRQLLSENLQKDIEIALLKAQKKLLEETERFKELIQDLIDAVDELHLWRNKHTLAAKKAARQNVLAEFTRLQARIKELETENNNLHEEITHPGDAA